MKKFRFRLETPLRIKQLKEKMEKQKFSQALYRKRTEESLLADMQLAKANARGEMENKLLNSVQIRELSPFCLFERKMLDLIENQEVVVKQVSEICEERRKDFLKSRIERQIYEKIREYQYKEYNIMVNKEEQKISDELASINYSRLERNSTYEEY